MTKPAAQPQKTALVSCMRNEGIFLLEWVAYHQGLGFDAIIVVTNDCTDGSDALAETLADDGQIIHIDQTVPPGDSPQDAGMDLALDWMRRHDVTWALHIDSDEFLLIEHERGQIQDLLADLARADVIPIAWRNFGDSGHANWTPGAAVLTEFTQAEPTAEPGIAKFKCLFRVDSFARATDHNPLEPQVDDPVVLSPDGETLSNGSLYQAKSSRFRPHDIACRATRARLNHYAVKSQDLFLMKNDRGDGQGKRDDRKYHLGSKWHRAANRNDVQDRAILRHWPDTQRRLTALRAVPAIALAEHACQDWFAARRDSFLTPDTRAALTKRKARA
ncbi:glycosyltransferase family 2 protein [Thalassobius sp. S69A]|uniref:glycosyltransferase family 2 protein n=1 Tax=unclassified Thalassovita TaxID=2619711 RepID=UPI003C7DA1DC